MRVFLSDLKYHGTLYALEGLLTPYTRLPKWLIHLVPSFLMEALDTVVWTQRGD